MRTWTFSEVQLFESWFVVEPGFKLQSVCFHMCLGDLRVFFFFLIFIFIYSFIWLHWLLEVACRLLLGAHEIWFPDQGQNLGPLHWEAMES